MHWLPLWIMGVGLVLLFALRIVERLSAGNSDVIEP